MGDNKPQPGVVSWVDLTVTEADKVRDFYSQVVGWDHDAVSMGDYDDYCMIRSGTKDVVAGICHARGPNADLPPQWLIYITVADLDASVASCRSLGGEVIAEPRTAEGAGRYCVVRDPAGAVAALFEPIAKP